MREIVLDTNVLVAAFRSKRGASYQLVRLIGLADWRLNVSVALALEYEDVLKRKDMLQEGITEAEVDAFLDYVFRTDVLQKRQRRQTGPASRPVWITQPLIRGSPGGTEPTRPRRLSATT
jgi:predicted nucleic acid-binding protein